MSAGGPVMGFGDRLSAHVQERQSQIVLGLDPDPLALWPDSRSDAAPAEAGGANGGPAKRVRAKQAALEVTAHCLALIDAAGPACVAVKPQLARFESLGALGWMVLEEIAAYARAQGLLVIADGKRGDIDVSARAYAEGLLGGVQSSQGPIEGLHADMLTVNPLMGTDAIEPFVEVARVVGAGVLALVRTSNPGAADIEELQLSGGELVWERIAALVERLGRGSVGEGGLSDVGAVVGATAPGHLARARQLMPHAVFLLPGVGAQGGRVEDLAPAFAPGRAGGLIAASRSIANAYLTGGGAPGEAARREAERLRAQAWALAG